MSSCLFRSKSRYGQKLSWAAVAWQLRFRVQDIGNWTNYHRENTYVFACTNSLTPLPPSFTTSSPIRSRVPFHENCTLSTSSQEWQPRMKYCPSFFLFVPVNVSFTVCSVFNATSLKWPHVSPVFFLHNHGFIGFKAVCWNFLNDCRNKQKEATRNTFRTMKVKTNHEDSRRWNELEKECSGSLRAADDVSTRNS